MPAEAIKPLPARWARAAIGSYFMVSATTLLANNPSAVAHVLIDGGPALPWMVIGTIVFETMTAVLFALGFLTRAVAMIWIPLALTQALLVHAFWAVPPTLLASTATAFCADIGVAASLLLYLDVSAARTN